MEMSGNTVLITGGATGIRHGMTEGLINASRADLDKSFRQMTSRW